MFCCSVSACFVCDDAYMATVSSMGTDVTESLVSTRKTVRERSGGIAVSRPIALGFVFGALVCVASWSTRCSAAFA